jgi:hypothetical protein
MQHVSKQIGDQQRGLIEGIHGEQHKQRLRAEQLAAILTVRSHAVRFSRVPVWVRGQGGWVQQNSHRIGVDGVTSRCTNFAASSTIQRMGRSSNTGKLLIVTPPGDNSLAESNVSRLAIRRSDQRGNTSNRQSDSVRGFPGVRLCEFDRQSNANGLSVRETRPHALKLR